MASDENKVTSLNNPYAYPSVFIDYKNYSLVCAVARNDEYSIISLLRAGVNPNIKNIRGITPLHIAMRYCDLNTIKLLLNAGADPNAADEQGITPLHRAVQYSRIKTIKSIIKLGADPNITNILGNTPLHLATSSNKEDVVKTLLSVGADPNIANMIGNTPLHSAAISDKENIAKILLNAGADPDITNKNGKTSLQRTKPGSEIKNLLEKWPSVVSLQTLCLRIVHFRNPKLHIPEWFPSILLEWNDNLNCVD